MPPKAELTFKRFHVLGTETCPYCVMLKGAIKMYLHSVSQSMYDRYVCYHDRNSPEELAQWEEEMGDVVPASHRTIPVVVAEFSDGRLRYIGGFNDFVQKIGGGRR